MQANVIYVAAHSQDSHLYSFVSEAIKIYSKNVRFSFYLNHPRMEVLYSCVHTSRSVVKAWEH